MSDAQTPVLTDEQIVLLARRVGGLFDDLAIGFQTDDILNFGRSVLAAQAPAQPADAVIPASQRAVMQQALDALEYHVEQTRPIERTTVAIASLRAALSATMEKT